jgi:uncharacterized membrane protein/glycosyltransferase involved in cell wall biosynthesis
MNVVAEPIENAGDVEPTPAVSGVRWAHLALMAAIPLLMLARDVWAVQFVSLVLLLTVPGVVLLRAVRVPGTMVVRQPIYVPAAAIAVLLAVGLAVNEIGILFGSDDPLRPVPLVIGLEVVCVALWLAGVRASASCDVRWSELVPSARVLWPLLLPLLSAAGAARLTTDHGAAVAIVAIIVAIVVLLAFVVRPGKASIPQLAFVLFGVSLAVVWGYSLRSRTVVGYDITTELNVARITAQTGIWHSRHQDDAYGAMLSLTVLPSLLHAVSGASILTLLKTVYPALLAVFPVGLFYLATRFVDRRWAFVAGSLVVTQSYFFAQMPGIARQEIGLLVFMALIAAVAELDCAPRRRAPLIAVLGLALVVSHYSTTYLALATFGLGAVLMVLVTAVRRPFRVPIALALAFVVCAGGAAVWYGAVTHSSSNADNFTADLRRNGLDLLPNAQKGEGFVKSYLGGNVVTHVAASKYQEDVARVYRRDHSYVTPLPEASRPRYDLRDANVPTGKVHEAAIGRRLGSLQTIAAQLVNILAIIGALWICVRRRSTDRERMLGVLALATLIVLAFLRLSGTAALAYNQERAFVQTMAALGVCAAIVLERAHAIRRVGVLVPVGTALMLLAIVSSTTGLRSVAFYGAGPPSLSDHGEDYERFYSTTPELAAATWLTVVPKQQLLYTDRYGQLRVGAATGRQIGAQVDVTPLTLGVGVREPGERPRWPGARADRERAVGVPVAVGVPRPLLEHGVREQRGEGLPAVIGDTRLSVVLAARNGERWLGEQLDSIASQTRPPDELIVSDDGSTDGTRGLVEAFARRASFGVRILDGPQTGLADNFWVAAACATGELIAWSDQDDVWLPGKLEQCERELLAHGADFVTHSAAVVDNERRPLGKKHPNYPAARCLEPLEGDPWHVPSGFATVFRRALLDQVDWSRRPISHQTGRVMNHDHALSLIAFAQGRRLELPNVLAEYRQHDANAAGAPRETRMEGIQHAVLRVGNAEFARLVPIARQYGEYAASTDRSDARSEAYFGDLAARCAQRSRVYGDGGAVPRVRALGRAVRGGVYQRRDAGGFGALALCKDVVTLGLQVASHVGR